MNFPLSQSLDLGAVTGLPNAPRGKKVRRGGRKKSTGKPGSQHHQQMNQAYARGDYATAKKHALNFANAMHAHGSASVASDTDDAMDAMDSAAPMQSKAAPMAAPKAVTPPAPATHPTMATRAKLAAALRQKSQKPSQKS